MKHVNFSCLLENEQAASATMKAVSDDMATDKKKEKNEGKISTKKLSFLQQNLMPDLSPPGWSLRGKSGDRVTCEARALGLSYGHYEAAVMAGTIEGMLADVGIHDGLKRIEKAWKDKTKQGRCDNVCPRSFKK